MPESTHSARLVLTSTSSREEAQRLAHALVEEQLAACASILPGAESVYRWQGAIETSAEALLLIKTNAACLDALETRLHALHSYETPEFLVLPLEAGSKGYLQWLEESLKKENGA
ncbi:divalent-cation tolerance protein CutA [Telmatobacter bradus]|uniref:divalent-cation tolerance protein CutA n=1 Tax=Telmatobacter bradus TaxID=474953 RepID=UPI003B4345D4